MSAIIYLLTVVYFSYVMHVVLGDQIKAFIKKDTATH
jgi:hypothetical protein